MPIKDPNKQRADSLRLALAAGRKARDITEGYPDPGDLARRDACERNLRLFCETYFPFACDLKWSNDHLEVLARMETVILHGGLFALAMPRGQGKSTISRSACLWGLLYGHRRYVCLIAATEKLAGRMLKAMKDELQYNDVLAADFRQVCYPLRQLENNGRNCAGQLFDGEQTRTEWARDRITFPTMPEWACDGVNVNGHTVSAVGLTGALRGQFQTLDDGTVVRPEVVILDDPQTRKSAMSESQSETRAAILKGDVLGMAGPTQRIAAIMPCTVIRAGDMADQMLDRKQNPEWCGQRHKMVYAFPTDERRWEAYADMRRQEFENGGDGSVSTGYYAENRVEMDAGAVVSWNERFKPGELSAIQSAMNLKIQDRQAFWAEYQNEPLPPDEAAGIELTAETVAEKTSGIARGTVPAECDRLTAFIDVQQELLYYAVGAWEPHFSGSIVDYGAFPDQKRAYFTLEDAKNTLSRLHPERGVEGRIYAGLAVLVDGLLSREWKRPDDVPLRIERLLIDAGHWTDTVLKFCRESKYAGIVMPSHGQFFGPDSKPLHEYRPEPGGRLGFHWRIPGEIRRGAVRHVNIDTNHWKSFVHRRLAVARGDRGCLTLFGDDPKQHRLIADHLVSESCFPQISEKTGRRVEVWKLKPGRPDNHWLDAIAGVCVAASMQGVALDEVSERPAERPKRISFAELQRKRQQGPPQPRP